MAKTPDPGNGFIIENLRLRELVTIVNTNQPFFADFASFLAAEGYTDVRAFVFEADDAKAHQTIERYLQQPPTSVLYDGLGRPYEQSKAKFYFLAWLFRDAPAQRLAPLIDRHSKTSAVRRRADLLNEIRRFVGPLFPDPNSWTWPAVSEVMLARLEGSRRALKGTFLEGVVRESELDPVSWTLSEGRIRCPEWDHTKRGDERVDSSRRSSGPVPSGWSWMRAKRSAPLRANWI